MQTSVNMHKLSLKIEKLLELFYEVRITLNPICDKDIIRKTNYMPILDAQTLSKTLVNQIQ